MPNFRDLAGTPAERIAARAHEVMCEILNRYKGAPFGPVFPNVADFRNGIGIDVLREILEAEIALASELGAHAVVAQKQGQLNRVKIEIATRDLAR